MTRVLVLYATDYGNTKKVAEAIGEGASSVPNVQADVRSVENVTADDLLKAHALILGSPVHMGSADWRVKKFIDQVCSGLWMKDALQGKVGAVFATGSGYGNGGGGNELTLLGMLSNLAELGMIIVPLAKSTPGYAQGGLQWGPYVRSAGEKMEQTGVQAEGLVAAKQHGVHVARLAQALQGVKIFG